MKQLRTFMKTKFIFDDLHWKLKSIIRIIKIVCTFSIAIDKCLRNPWMSSGEYGWNRAGSMPADSWGQGAKRFGVGPQIFKIDVQTNYQGHKSIRGFWREEIIRSYDGILASVVRIWNEPGLGKCGSFRSTHGRWAAWTKMLNKSSLVLTQYAMKMYGRVDIKLHAFLTSVFCGAEWLDWRNIGFEAW
jgi:hypothetical protein